VGHLGVPPQGEHTQGKRVCLRILELRSLTPFFERRQARFCSDALSAVEFDVFVDQLSGLIKSFQFMPVNAFGFENGK